MPLEDSNKMQVSRVERPFGSSTLVIETGAWELTEHTVIEGVPLPQAELEKLTAAQRDEMEVKMRDSADDGARVISRSCLTQAALDSSAVVGNAAANCTRGSG